MGGTFDKKQWAEMANRSLEAQKRHRRKYFRSLVAGSSADRNIYTAERQVGLLWRIQKAPNGWIGYWELLNQLASDRSGGRGIRVVHPERHILLRVLQALVENGHVARYRRQGANLVFITDAGKTHLLKTLGLKNPLQG